MKPISNQHYIPRGNLAARAGLLASRLEMREYRPETVLNMDQAGCVLTQPDGGAQEGYGRFEWNQIVTVYYPTVAARLNCVK